MDGGQRANDHEEPVKDILASAAASQTKVLIRVNDDLNAHEARFAIESSCREGELGDTNTGKTEGWLSG